MSVIKIDYRFEMDNGQCQIFNAALDSTSLRISNTPKSPYPTWCELGFHQCPICSLTGVARCPAAKNMAHLVERFDQLLSYDTTMVSVTMDERTTFSRTSVQRGICSLMGLLMAASDCPFTAFFKPMARFHLPLATAEETIWRAASIYLMAQYFRQQKGEAADLSFDGLSRIYRQIQIVNSSFAKRLRHASSCDSMINGIVLLDMFAKSMPHAIDQSLEHLRGLFVPYLSNAAVSPRE